MAEHGSAVLAWAGVRVSTRDPRRGGLLVDDSVLTTLGLIVGVALLYMGARIRRRSQQRVRRPDNDAG